MTDHDKAIIEAAKKTADWYRGALLADDHPARDLVTAVDANREAMKPKLLTAEEAFEVWRISRGNRMEAVGEMLTACHERAYRVIEGLPRHAVHTPSESFVTVYIGDIRAALQVKP